MCFSEPWVSSLDIIQLLGLNEAQVQVQVLVPNLNLVPGSGPGTKPCQSLLCDLRQVSQLL